MRLDQGLLNFRGTLRVHGSLAQQYSVMTR
jgi:hypothetical protein